MEESAGARRIIYVAKAERILFSPHDLAQCGGFHKKGGRGRRDASLWIYGDDTA
jgi:hypothetical protein